MSKPADLETFSRWMIGPAQEPVVIGLRLYDLYLLLGQIQLGVTHPQLGRGLKRELFDLGHAVEAAIAEVAPPEIIALMAEGWKK